MAGQNITAPEHEFNSTTSYKVGQNVFLAVCTLISALITAAVSIVAAYYLLIYKKSSFSSHRYNDLLMGLQALMGVFLALTGYTWTAVAHFRGEWPAREVGCSLATFCLLFFGTMTVMITLVMSAERFAAMCCPFYYQRLINAHKITGMVLYLFVHGAFLAGLPLFLNSIELTRKPIAVCLYSLSSHSTNETIVVHAFVCNFSLCLLLMLLTNLCVLRALSKMKRSVGVGLSTGLAERDRESIIMSNLTGIMALSYTLCWLPIVVRVILRYYGNWHSFYFDLFAFSVSTADPFVHPVTCMMVSQRYRAGYKAALRHILSILWRWFPGSGSKSRVVAVHYVPNKIDLASLSKVGSLNQSLKLAGNILKTETSIRTAGKLEATETQEYKNLKQG